MSRNYPQPIKKKNKYNAVYVPISVEEVDWIAIRTGFKIDKENDLFYCDQGAVIEPICLKKGQTLKEYKEENKLRINDYIEKGYSLSIGPPILIGRSDYRDGAYTQRNYDYSNYTLCCKNYQKILKQETGQYFLSKVKQNIK